MSKHTFKADIRTITGRKVKSLRKKGLVPAVVYGKQAKTANLQISAKEFGKLHSQAGESTLIYLQVAGEKEDRPVLIRQVVLDAVNEGVLHVDFHQVNLKEKVKAAVPLKLIGEAPAEKDHLGILVQQLNEVEVEALPTDMPEHFDVDVSGLVDVNQAVLVKDIKVSAKVEVITGADQIVAKIEHMAKEEVKEEVAPTPEAPANPDQEVAPVEGSPEPEK